MSRVFAHSGDDYWIDGEPVSKERWEAQFTIQQQDEANEEEPEDEDEDDPQSR